MMTVAMKESMLVMLNIMQHQLDSMREALLSVTPAVSAPVTAPVTASVPFSSSEETDIEEEPVTPVPVTSVVTSVVSPPLPVVSTTSAPVNKSQEKPYKCSKCPKKYSSKKPFQKHVDNNCGKVFFCRICEKSYFSQKKSYDKHLEICRQKSNTLSSPPCPPPAPVVQEETVVQEEIVVQESSVCI
jgi:hypothetical protein